MALENLAERTLKHHPWVFLFILICMTSMGAWALEEFAKNERVDRVEDALKEKVDRIEKRVQKLETRVDRRYLQQRLHNLEAEIFQLERIIAAPGHTERDMTRLDKLKIERGDIQRELGRLH